MNTGVITPDEAREGLGMSVMDTDETNCIRVPQNITGSATDASQGGRPSEDEIQIITEDDEDLANE